MLAQQRFKPIRQAKLSAPHGDLIGLEGSIGQLDIQQPIVDIRRFRPRPVDQELLLGLLSKHAMLQGEFIVRHRRLGDIREIDGRECFAHLAVWVRPDDDSMFFELRGEALRDALLHDQSSASSRPLIGLSAPANFG